MFQGSGKTEIIMIHKLGKEVNDKKSYRPISLLPIISKVFEKLLLNRLNPILQKKDLISIHQFGFRKRHSTIEQVHRITEETLEKRRICLSVFLDICQAFDKVWHEGLNYKLKQMLPIQYCEILKSYVSDRFFRMITNTRTLRKSQLPQRSVLDPTLYLLYTRDILRNPEILIAIFANDMTTGDVIEEATNRLQRAIDRINIWTKK